MHTCFVPEVVEPVGGGCPGPREGFPPTWLVDDSNGVFGVLFESSTEVRFLKKMSMVILIYVAIVLLANRTYFFMKNLNSDHLFFHAKSLTVPFNLI